MVELANDDKAIKMIQNTIKANHAYVRDINADGLGWVGGRVFSTAKKWLDVDMNLSVVDNGQQ